MAGTVRLKGRIVCNLKQETEWDGRDEGGQPCESGVYLYQIEAGGRRFSGTVVLIQ